MVAKDTCTSSSTTNYALLGRGNSNPTSSIIDCSGQREDRYKGHDYAEYPLHGRNPSFSVAFARPRLRRHRFCYKSAKHSPRFAILRHGFSLSIQHTEFFSRCLPHRVPDKCKRWRLRYYEHKDVTSEKKTSNR